MADVQAVSKMIRQIAFKGRDLMENVTICFVKSVNLDDNTCDCTPVDTTFAEFLGVRMVAEYNTTNFVIVPKVNSIVGVLEFSDFEACDTMLLFCSEVETILLRGDQFGGVPKATTLTTKLNNIENKLNELLTAYNAHIHPTPAGASSVTVSTVVGVLTPTLQTDIENENVKQG